MTNHCGELEDLDDIDGAVDDAWAKAVNAMPQPIVVTKGGPGSGNWGHAGRPGKVGGSLPSSVALSRTSGKTATARYIAAKRGSPTLALADMRNQDWKDIPGFKYEPGGSPSGVVQLTHDGKAIVKPKKAYDEYNRDEAVYKLTEAAGWSGMTPPSIGVEVQPGQYYSAQQWVENKKQAWSIQQDVLYGDGKETRAYFGDTKDLDNRSFSRMALMDGAIQNRDRHSGNFLISKDGKAVMIDHNLSLDPWGSPQSWREFENVESYWQAIRYQVFGKNQYDHLKVHSTDFNSLVTAIRSEEITTYITNNLKDRGDITHDLMVNRMFDLKTYLISSDRWIED